MNKDILTKDRNSWEEYIGKLEHLLNSHMENTGVYKCRHDFTYTRRILNNMPGIDVDGTIEYLRNEFGNCDCEVYTVSL